MKEAIGRHKRPLWSIFVDSRIPGKRIFNQRTCMGIPSHMIEQNTQKYVKVHKTTEITQTQQLSSQCQCFKSYIGVSSVWYQMFLLWCHKLIIPTCYKVVFFSIYTRLTMVLLLSSRSHTSVPHMTTLHVYPLTHPVCCSIFHSSRLDLPRQVQALCHAPSSGALWKNIPWIQQKGSLPRCFYFFINKTALVFLKWKGGRWEDAKSADKPRTQIRSTTKRNIQWDNAVWLQHFFISNVEWLLEAMLDDSSKQSWMTLRKTCLLKHRAHV